LQETIHEYINAILNLEKKGSKMQRILSVFVCTIVAILLTAPSYAAGLKLRLDPELLTGIGGTFGKVYSETGNASFHLSGGGTFFTLDQGGHIGLLGVGAALDLYDFSGNSADIRDLSREDGGYAGLSGYFNWVGTIIPIRIGPLAYQFSWNPHVKSLGYDRGRLHMFTFDILGCIRLVRSSYDW
jgi:hypothetical protein